MLDLVETMSRDFYGYGKWDAPFWFIGSEPGGDGNERRAREFARIGVDGLCDCKVFHEAVEEFRWHREPPEKTILQPTWRRLMLSLMPSLKLGTDQAALREYQCRHWGMRNGETCVIELGGLSARSLATAVDRNSFRDRRINLIKAKMERSSPQLVVMYGAGSRDAWNTISACNYARGHLMKPGKTQFAFMHGPTAAGERDDEWIDLGARIAQQL
jgi:hypothetical protein